MGARTRNAEGSVFWPGLSSDVERARASCRDCDTIAPSQSKLPPEDRIVPCRPFQCVAADYFELSGTSYLVVVDRFSSWPHVVSCKSAHGSKGLVIALRHYFATFGIAEELASDGGPEFMAGETQQFLRNWGVEI